MDVVAILRITVRAVVRSKKLPQIRPHSGHDEVLHRIGRLNRLLTRETAIRGSTVRSSKVIWRGHFVLSSRVLPLSGETDQVPDISKWLRYTTKWRHDTLPFLHPQARLVIRRLHSGPDGAQSPRHRTGNSKRLVACPATVSVG
jgi:hypothetical protein